MKKKPFNPRSEWRGYPPDPVSTRVGIKVSWHTYATEAEAKACSEAARWNARIQEQAGYDFGYCAPGSIEKVTLGWEVCLP